MKTLSITVDLVQVENIRQMANQHGQRIENLPFFCESGKDVIHHFLTRQTDKIWLMERIKEGRIYLLRQHVDNG